MEAITEIEDSIRTELIPGRLPISQLPDSIPAIPARRVPAMLSSTGCCAIQRATPLTTMAVPFSLTTPPEDEWHVTTRLDMEIVMAKKYLNDIAEDGLVDPTQGNAPCSDVPLTGQQEDLNCR